MKILIYGSKGWIGQQVIKELNRQNILYIEGIERAINQEELINEINKINPTHIFSLIARTHGDIGEKNYTTIDYLQDSSKVNINVRDNLYSPLVLAIICEKMNIHLTYFGSGCLFEYDDTHIYNNDQTGFTELDKPNFFGSHYSTIKGYTDQLMKLFNNTLTLRIRMCLTEEPNARNFITKLVTYKKICSIPNSMSVLPELIPILIDMAKNKITGIYNFTNPGLITHNEILEMYKEIIDPNLTWSNMTFEEQHNLLAAGRSNNYLDVNKLQKLYPNIKDIKVATRECLIKYKDNIN
jgi:dTDP-4-dehydrorhamnose reductase